MHANPPMARRQADRASAEVMGQFNDILSPDIRTSQRMEINRDSMAIPREQPMILCKQLFRKPLVASSNNDEIHSEQHTDGGDF
jgi:hypothetical protein